MKNQQQTRPFYAKPLYRWLTGGFGVFLIAIGLYALLFVGSLTAPRVIAGVVLDVLGCNMLAAAYRAKESWLSRLGPLP